jgi:hypothetical protein
LQRYIKWNRDVLGIGVSVSIDQNQNSYKMQNKKASPISQQSSSDSIPWEDLHPYWRIAFEMDTLASSPRTITSRHAESSVGLNKASSQLSIS